MPDARQPRSSEGDHVMSALFKKMNLSTQSVVHVLNAPDSMKTELALLKDHDVRRTLTKKDKTGFAVAFATTQAELDKVSATLAAAAEGDAVIWIAYPKQTSKKYRCEFNRDSGWTVLGDAGFETVRMVAIDDDWSALRFRRAEFVKSITRNVAIAVSAAGKKRARKA
jgi:hypothetical protein